KKYVSKCKNKTNNDNSDIDNNNNDTNNNNDNNIGDNNNNINDDTSNKESKSPVVHPYNEGTSETILRRILDNTGRNKSGWHSNHPKTQLETSFVGYRVNPVEPIKQNNLVYPITYLQLLSGQIHGSN
ncbi:unnamed protein product, partial [Trichobilharzia regenti]